MHLNCRSYIWKALVNLQVQVATFRLPQTVLLDQYCRNLAYLASLFLPNVLQNKRNRMAIPLLYVYTSTQIHDLLEHSCLLNWSLAELTTLFRWGDRRLTYLPQKCLELYDVWRAHDLGLAALFNPLVRLPLNLGTPPSRSVLGLLMHLYQPGFVCEREHICTPPFSAGIWGLARLEQPLC